MIETNNPGPPDCTPLTEKFLLRASIISLLKALLKSILKSLTPLQTGLSKNLRTLCWIVYKPLAQLPPYLYANGYGYT